MKNPSPIADLSELLVMMEPRLNEGVYAYALPPAGADVSGPEVFATVREAEGLTAVVEESEARRRGWLIIHRAAWITLTVHSDLKAVGLTAAVATALSEAGISCNVIAAVHHDHLFVPASQGIAAMDSLRLLQQRTAAAVAAARQARPSATSLRSIVYVSAAIQAMSEFELESLLVEARDLNLESGVTGVLLYSDGNFLQYFEGTEEAMRATYERIRASTRHKNIIELLDEPIAARNFEDWQMGFAQPTRTVLLALSTAHWERQAELARGADSVSPGMDLLLTFWGSSRP